MTREERCLRRWRARARRDRSRLRVLTPNADPADVEPGIMTPIEIDPRPEHLRPSLAHGDQPPPWKRNHTDKGLRILAEEVRHTRGSWESGW